MIEAVPISHVIAVTILMFFIGVYGFISRKNLFTVLMSLELMLNAGAINFATFNKYLFPDRLHGHFFSVFMIGIAAAEAALAIAIIINIYRNINSVNTDKINELKY